MKFYALAFLLLLAACTPTEQADLREAAEGLKELKELGESLPPPEELYAAECDEPVDPQVMLDAFPAQVGSYVEVGETIAERSELPTPDGVTKQSMALRTLTVNDETYISFTGTDACGFNTNVAQMKLMFENDDEWGSTKRVTVDGKQAWITRDARSDIFDVYVLLGDRVLITTNGDVSEELTLEAAGNVDYDSIESALS